MRRNDYKYRRLWMDTYLASLPKATPSPSAPAPPTISVPGLTFVVPKQKPAKSVQPCVEDATNAQKQTIYRAHEDAKVMIDNAIKRLEDAKTKPDPLVDQFFAINGTGEDDVEKLDELIETYKEMRGDMDKVGYEVENEPIKPGEAQSIAYVRNYTAWFGIGDVHVGFPVFDLLTAEEQASTIVHEMAHYSFSADDEAYEWQTGKWNDMSQGDMMDNADSYASFAKQS